MKKAKQILAIIGIVVIVLLYISTLVFAALGEHYTNWLMASVAATIMVPVLIWVYGFIYKILKRHGEELAEEAKNQD